MGVQPPDPDRLPAIKRELECRRLRLSFDDAALEAEFNQQRMSRGYRQNRLAIVMTIALFDLFILGEVKSCPEVLVLSAVFRFGIVTPACLAYLYFNGRRQLGSWSEFALAALLFLPTFLGSIETYAVYHVEALPNFQSIPLIQLALLTCRLNVKYSIYSVALACLTFIIVACTKDYVPAVVVPSLILNDISIGVTVIFFSSRLDYRERQVFLFELQSDLGRSLLAAQNEKLSRLTRVDALTGLGNRRCFDEMIESLWSDMRTRHDPVTLILFDIDFFKQYNDSLGHRAGDECLASLASAVAQCLRDNGDKLARYGGEEFAIVLPGLSCEEGRAIAERVRLTVLERAIPHPGSASTGSVTVSLGVASVVPASHSAAALVEQADRCLYKAKHAGRNIVVKEPLGDAAQLPSEALAVANSLASWDVTGPRHAVLATPPGRETLPPEWPIGNPHVTRTTRENAL